MFLETGRYERHTYYFALLLIQVVYHDIRTIFVSAATSARAS